MKRELFAFISLIAFLVPLASADGAERKSTAADRQFVNLTIYNAGTAIVHDRRMLHMNAGINHIAWRDVSSSMDPTTAVLDDLSPSSRVDVLEQNYDYDALTNASLLDKYVGKTVTIVHPAQFEGEVETKEPARVLSAGDNVVLQYRDRVEVGIRGYVQFPSIPKNLRDVPTLELDLQADRAGGHLLDLDYSTSGFSWYANYVGTLARDERSLNLIGLVTLSNTSGASYENAHLQLLAGNVNVQPPPRALQQIARVVSRSAGDVYSVNGAPSEENAFEYHLYTFARTTTILNQQTKQLSLLSAHSVPVQKTLELRGASGYYESADADLGERLPVGVYLTFVNHGGDLGIPLPAGTVRLFENDSHGLAQLIGSDRINHTPNGDTVRLNLGNSFDVVGRKKQTDFQVPERCVSTSSYEIRLHNGKEVGQQVLVVEPIPGDWAITQESAPHLKTSSSTANWTVTVPPQGEQVLTYTARVRWCRQ